MNKTCEMCKYGFLRDYGYSNYTTEGTTFRCLKIAHPEVEFDRWYGENQSLNYANECPSYVSGEALKLDCDREGLGYPPDWSRLTDDNDVLPLLLAWAKENS